MRKIFDVMKLEIKSGEELTVTVSGKDEDIAVSKLEKFMNSL